MDDRGNVVRFPAVVKNVSHLQNAQIFATAHPATCSVDTRSPFSGSKEAGEWSLGSWCRQVPRWLTDYRPALYICAYLNSPLFGNFFLECIQLFSNAYSQNRAGWGLQLSTCVA